MKTIILDLAFILGSIYLIVLCQLRFNEDRRSIKHHFDRFNLNKKCKDYLLTLKANTGTAMYSFMAATVSSLIFYVSFRIIQNSIELSTRQIAFTTIFIFLLTFGTSYKTLNCMLSRTICPGNCEVELS